MKRKEIRKLHALANLAHAIKQQGEDAAADTILNHIAHTIHDNLGAPDGNTQNSNPAD